jgi:alpha-L-rhamnosidase
MTSTRTELAGPEHGRCAALHGLVPDLVPENIVFSGGFRDDVNWGSAIIQTPWQIYQNYGDTAVLSTYYPNMVNYMNYLQTRVTGSLVSYGSSGLGDWGETSVTSITTPIDLVENWGYYRDEVAMANIAKVLGKAADQQQYAANAAATLAAFTATWYNPSTKTVANGTQSSLAMALDIGAVPASASRRHAEVGRGHRRRRRLRGGRDRHDPAVPRAQCGGRPAAHL